jgi:hypothetical protein
VAAPPAASAQRLCIPSAIPRSRFDGEDTIVNTTLPTEVTRSHPPQPALHPLTPLDRVALHLGIALIRWGRRSHLLTDARLLVNAQRRHERERFRTEREMLLITRLR